MDESAQNDGQASNLWDFKAGTATVIMWVFMVIHVEKARDMRTS